MKPCIACRIEISIKIFFHMSACTMITHSPNSFIAKPLILIFRRNISTQEFSSPITIEADEFVVISEQDLILARGNPRIQWQSARIQAKTLQYQQRTDTLELLDNVKISYEDISARGRSANYLTKLGKVILKGQAQAQQGDNNLSGDKVSVSLIDKKISVIGKGKVVITEEGLK